MKNFITVVLLLFTTNMTLAGMRHGNEVNELTPSQKVEIATEFLLTYDKNRSIIDWKIKVREDRVILSRRWSLQRIVLFDAFFIEKIKEQQATSEI